jgi:Acyl-coenzyme A synthetases/AMP-(fatty) acid ligases
MNNVLLLIHGGRTETGGILMSPISGCVPTKPGSATLPLPGIIPAILDEERNEITERNTTWLF